MAQERKKGGCLKALIIVVLIVGVVIFVVARYGGTSTDSAILSVQYSSPPGESVKFIRAFKKFFAEPKWESIIAADGETYVNFSGKAFYNDNIELYELQFHVGEDNGVSFWKLRTIEVNGAPQNIFFINGLIDKVYEGL